jgi:hypothetical protein
MPKDITLQESFAHFSARGSNPRWSWSARSDNGDTVVLTLWKDRLRYSPAGVAYDEFGTARAEGWMDRPGNRERLANLKWARDHCDGLFKVVVVVAEDTAAQPRKIKECFPQAKLLMRLTDLDESTGEFRAISVDR